MIQRDWNKLSLKDAFFPVFRERVFWKDGQGRERLIPNSYTLVDNHGYPLSVVSDKYNVVNNEDAYHWADYVIRGVFPGHSLSEFECFNMYMPRTRASCRIDLIIPQSYRYPFGEELDSWVPFIRISNSYNKTITLKYEIGFCRWICKNGLIFGQRGLTLSFNHNQKISEKQIRKTIVASRREIGEIESLWNVFENKLHQLKKITVPKKAWLPIYCKAFGVDATKEELTKGQVDIMTDRACKIIKTSDEYAEELGENAYALMNVLTDFASFPVGTNNASTVVHGYQRKVGSWVNDFLVETNKEDFSLDKYIGEHAQASANRLNELVA